MEKTGIVEEENDEKQEKPPINSGNEDKVSIVSIVCRICFDDNKDEPIITPCHCKGTVAFVHRSCLEKWLAESNTTSCELCHHIYETERVPKYTAAQSIWKWFRNQPQQLGFHIRRTRGDLLACAILTPLAIVITYICLFSADYYNQRKFANIPAAKWTSISLLVMISIMLFGYYIWVYVVVGYHGRTWYYWWQRECIVRYIPPTTIACEEGCATMAEIQDDNHSNSSSGSNIAINEQPPTSNQPSISNQGSKKDLPLPEVAD